jgi:hypothetical protein
LGSIKSCSRRLLLLSGLAALVWHADVLAQDSPRSIAIVSLLCDSIRVVGQEPTTGSRVNRNPVESIAVTFDALELPALRAATAAVLKADASAKVAPLKITDAAVYAAQSNMVAGAKADLPAAILNPLKEAKITHLVLITRYRDEARMDTGRQVLGSGKVEGVGYYLDRETQIRLLSDGAVSVGFLAPFVYARVSLVDLATLQVIRSQVTTVGQAITAAATKTGGDPWDILDNAGKVDRLRKMLERQIEETVTLLFKTP